MIADKTGQYVLIRVVILFPIYVPIYVPMSVSTYWGHGWLIMTTRVSTYWGQCSHRATLT